MLAIIFNKIIGKELNFRKFLKKLVYSSVSLFLFSLIFAGMVNAEPSYPERPRGYVNDYAGVLGDTTALGKRIESYRNTSTNEIAVVTVDNLQGVSIDEYALGLFEKWGLGLEDVDNGVLLLIAVEDKKVRIEVGYGLEGSIPDSIAGEIIRNEITPSFTQGNYYDGVSNGVDAIIEASENEYKLEDQDGNTTNYKNIYLIVIIIVIVIVIVLIARSKSGGKGNNGSSVARRTYKSPESQTETGFKRFGGGRSGGKGASGNW